VFGLTSAPRSGLLAEFSDERASRRRFTTTTAGSSPARHRLLTRCAYENETPKLARRDRRRNPACVLGFATRRQNRSPQRPRIRAHFARTGKNSRNKDSLAGAGGFEPRYFGFGLSAKLGTRDFSRMSCKHRRHNVAQLSAGTAPADLTVTGLAKALPYSWAEQESSIGFPQ
jgi:hypothetical protein